MNVLVHTPADTAGVITAHEDGGQVIIEVSDDGPGVPPDQLPHLFERFYRTGARSRCPSSGLGLAIAAEIAAAHGGTACAAPNSPNGPRITLALPAAAGRTGPPLGTAGAVPAAFPLIFRGPPSSDGAPSTSAWARGAAHHGPGVPGFVVTHRTREDLLGDNGGTFAFDGLEAAARSRGP